MKAKRLVTTVEQLRARHSAPQLSVRPPLHRAGGVYSGTAHGQVLDDPALSILLRRRRMVDRALDSKSCLGSCQVTPGRILALAIANSLDLLLGGCPFDMQPFGLVDKILHSRSDCARTT